MHTVQIQTRDGRCPSYVFSPDTPGPWPAVLVFMDGIGIRPEMLAVGERLARSGYFVLLPDLFYRSGPYAPMNPRELFADPDKRKVLMEKYFAPASQANIMSDTRSFLDYLGQQPGLRPGGIGAVGYCMGGLMALTAAGTYPDAFRAVASYHGGRLATDAPESPHQLASRMRARIYVAGAIEDAAFPDEQKRRLQSALSEAGVDHQIETYPAKHGWVFSDTPAYNAAAHERHWHSLLQLFDTTLKH